MYGTVKKTHQFIYMPYYVAPETLMMSPVIADCPDLVPLFQYFGQVYASDRNITEAPEWGFKYQASEVEDRIVSYEREAEILGLMH